MFKMLRLSLNLLIIEKSYFSKKLLEMSRFRSISLFVSKKREISTGPSLQFWQIKHARPGKLALSVSL
jgi:hypothetical protein